MIVVVIGGVGVVIPISGIGVGAIFVKYFVEELCCVVVLLLLSVAVQIIFP